MKTADQILQDFTKKNIIIKNAKKEAEILHQFIKDNEEIVAVLDAVGLCVLTNERIIVLYKDWIKGIEVKEFNLVDINSIEVIGGMLSSTLKIGVAGSSKDFMVPKKEKALEFKNHVTNSQALLKNKTSQPQIDVAGQLEKLADLKVKGILTEEEFQSQKKKLLAL